LKYSAWRVRRRERGDIQQRGRGREREREREREKERETVKETIITEKYEVIENKLYTKKTDLTQRRLIKIRNICM
jgi:phage antirepressor YoqD-like protein